MAEARTRDVKLIDLIHMAVGGLQTVPELSTVVLEGGMANHGSYLHELSLGELGSFQWIEKRTSLEREVKFYQNIASKYLVNEDKISPIVYAIEKHPEYTTIIMERVPDVGRPFDRTPENAQLLASKVAIISRIRKSDCPSTAVMITSSLIRKFLACIHREDLSDFINAERRELFVGLVEYAERVSASHASRLERIASHNDIYIPNMSLDEGRSRNRLVLIDWGKFSTNFVGAEWHHFFQESLKEEQGSVFFDVLMHSYADELSRRGIRYDVRDIKYGAIYYALQRSMSRFIRNPSTKGADNVVAVYAAMRAL